MPDELMGWSGDSTPEEREEGMKEWMVWAEKCGERLVDFGTPLMGGKKLFQNGNSQDSQRQLCGYSILEAESMEEAEALLKGHPHLTWNEACEIEVHESAPPPGM